MLMFLSLELLTFSYCSVQKRIDRAGLMQLSLEKPACEVGHWMVSRSLQSKEYFPKMLRVSHCV